MKALLLSFPLTYLLHSSALLLAALLVDKLRLLRRAGHVEAMWRAALLGGLLTAAIAIASAGPAPGIARATLATVPGVALPAPAPRAAPGVAPAGTVVPAPAPTVERGGALAAPSRALRASPWALPDGAGLLAAIVALAWSLGTLLRLAHVALQWSRLWRTARALPACTDAALLAYVAGEARAAGLAPPALRLSRSWQSPLVAPGRRICLPQWCFERLDAAQRQAVLAHEFAHVLRRDPAWRLASAVGCALGWLQPLNRLATRRLDALAEEACDSWAARRGPGPTALASVLLACARALEDVPPPRAALAMATTRSPLVQRVLRLVTGGPMELPLVSRRHWWAIAAIGAVLAIALPAVTMHGGLPDLHDLLVFERGSVRHVVMRWPGGHHEITIRGAVALADDESAVLQVERRLDIEEGRDGHSVAAYWEPGKDRIPTLHYLVDGSERRLDAPGQAWLAAQMPRLADAVLGTEGRMRVLEARGGTEAVLRVIEAGGDEATRRTFIGSLAQRPRPDPQVAWRLLAASTALRDEGLQRETLLALVPAYDDSPDARAAWEPALAALHEDYDVQPVLAALATRALPGESTARLVLQAAQRSTRDEDRAAIIELLGAQVRTVTPVQVIEAAGLARGIRDDYLRRRALLALAGHPNGDGDTSVAILQALDGIKPSENQAAVLLAVAAHMPADPAIVTQLRHASRGLAPYERGQLEVAMDHLALD